MNKDRKDKYDKYKEYIKNNDPPTVKQLATLWGVSETGAYKNIRIMETEGIKIQKKGRHKYNYKKIKTRDKVYSKIIELYKATGEAPKNQHIANALGISKQALSQIKIYMKADGYDLSLMDRGRRGDVKIRLPIDIIKYLSNKAAIVGTDIATIIQGIVIKQHDLLIKKEKAE